MVNFVGFDFQGHFCCLIRLFCYAQVSQVWMFQNIDIFRFYHTTNHADFIMEFFEILFRLVGDRANLKSSQGLWPLICCDEQSNLNNILLEGVKEETNLLIGRLSWWRIEINLRWGLLFVSCRGRSHLNGVSSPRKCECTTRPSTSTECNNPGRLWT